ncbi:DUF1801 domain-containing protein [Plantibacter flavus]|uniref:iron chaperone n=1 Tax=Plantibacter flavus TaxID=150123 RepID=UPI003F162939
MASAPTTIDDYLASQPSDAADAIEEIRLRVHRVVPGLTEAIRYGMPTFMLDDRYLVYLGAWKHHIALYSIPRFDGSLEQAVSDYRAAKDTLQFPFSRPIPFDLIDRIVAELFARRRAADARHEH